MSELEQKKLEAEIINLQAQTAKALSDAAKIDAEKNSLQKSWRDSILEATKVFGALVLGAGGITAAITGYQISEVRKEKMELEISKGRAQLDDLNVQKASTQQQLVAIKAEVEGLQTSLEAARKARSTTGTTGLLDEAINRAADIGKAVATTNAQLRSLDQSAASHKTSDYLVGLQTLGVPDTTREQLNQKLREEGYSLHEISHSYQTDARPPWLASRPTILYYARSSLAAAKQLAGVMKKLTGNDFAVQRGSGLGVDPGQQDVTLFVHYAKN